MVSAFMFWGLSEFLQKPKREKRDAITGGEPLASPSEENLYLASTQIRMT